MARTNCLGSRLVWNRRGRSRSICLEWQLIRLEWKSACHAWYWHKKRLKKMLRICTFVELFKFFLFLFGFAEGSMCVFCQHIVLFSNKNFSSRKKQKNRTKSTLPHWMWILASFWVNHIRKTKGCTMIDFNMQMTQPSLNRWHCFSQSSLYICTLREVPWQQSWKTVEDHRFRIPPLLMHRRTNYEPWH